MAAAALAALPYLDISPAIQHHQRRGTKYRYKGGYSGEAIRYFNAKNGVGSSKRRAKAVAHAPA